MGKKKLDFAFVIIYFLLFFPGPIQKKKRFVTCWNILRHFGTLWNILWQIFPLRHFGTFVWGIIPDFWNWKHASRKWEKGSGICRRFLFVFLPPAFLLVVEIPVMQMGTMIYLLDLYIYLWMDLVFVLAHVAGVLIPERYSGLPTAYSQVKLLYLSLFPSAPPIADV